MSSQSNNFMCDQLGSLKLMLKSELDILTMCLEEIDYVQTDQRVMVKELIEATTIKIKRELKQIESQTLMLQQKGNITEQEKENYDLLKLRVNRILIQNEKIFNCNSHFKKIVRKVQRIYSPNRFNVNSFNEQEQSLQQQYPYNQSENQFTLGPTKTQAIQTEYYNNENNINENNQSKTFNTTKQKSETKKYRQQQDMRETSQENKPDYQFIKQYIQEFKDDLTDLKKKVDTHQHQEYDDQINKMNQDNSRIIAECHLLKSDNTELFHISNDLNQRLSNISTENLKLERQIEDMRVLVNRIIQNKILSNEPLDKSNKEQVSEQQIERTSWFLIPQQGDEQRSQTSSWVKTRLP